MPLFLSDKHSLRNRHNSALLGLQFTQMQIESGNVDDYEGPLFNSPRIRVSPRAGYKYEKFGFPSHLVSLDIGVQREASFFKFYSSLFASNGHYLLESRFTDQPTLAIPDINDGTVNTVALGQVHSDLGPWIAAGSSTSRFLDPPGEQARTPEFGSRHAGAAWFANGDSYTYFLDIAATDPGLIHAVAGRDDGKHFDQSKLPRFESVEKWLEFKKLKGGRP